MIVKSRILPLGLLIAPALLLEGCATSPIEHAPIGSALEPRQQREVRLQNTWRGKPYHALLEARGTPKVIMNLSGYRPLKTSIAVYDVVDKATNCIDSFTVVTQNPSGDQTISDYFCR